MNFHLRKKSTLEPRLFRGLAVRLIAYGMLLLGIQVCLVSMQPLARWAPKTGDFWQDRILEQTLCTTLSFLLLAPIVFFDARTVLHRLTGPMLRLNRAMRRLADGEAVEVMRFRKHDYWGEAAENLNRLLKRLAEPAFASAPRSPTTSSSSELTVNTFANVKRSESKSSGPVATPSSNDGRENNSSLA